MATTSAKSGAKSTKKSTSTAKSTAKKTTSAAKSTKKKTTAASKKTETQNDGLGLGTILNVVEQLTGGGSSAKKKSKKSEESPLAALLSSLTGGSDGSINYAAIIEVLLPLLLSNKKHSDSFQSNPADTIKKLTGVTVSDQHLGPIVEQVLGKLNSK